MFQPKRPSGVPARAFWNEKEKEWQLGELKTTGRIKKTTFPTGRWQYWTSDGYLCCVAHLDGEGALDGILERYHPDGSLAYRGEWRHGRQHGHFMHIQCEKETREDYPADERTWRYEFDSTANWEEKNERWFLADGTECTFDGRPLDSAYDLDDAISQAQPENFLVEHAEKVCAAFGEPRVLLSDPMETKELWGVNVPQLDRLVSFAIEGDNFTPESLRRKFEGNCWRKMIASPVHSDIFAELASAFVGAVKIGYFGDSDMVYATLLQLQRNKNYANAVYLWSHETNYIDDVLAGTLDAFAFRMAVACAHSQQRISNRVARDAWKKLAGRVYLFWGLDSGWECATEAPEDDLDRVDEEELIDRDVYKANLDPENIVRGFFWRGQWIIHLLRPDDERDWERVRDCFYPNWNIPLDDAAHRERVEWGLEAPQWAIYLLWRYFWFDQRERLKECCLKYRDHSARMVRDLVSLLEEVGAGKVEIGGIKNILDVRARFLEFDLLPERSESRAEESAATAAVEVSRVNSLTEQAHESARQGLDSFLQFAWSHADHPALLAQIEPVARTFPGFEMQWRALDWVRGGGYSRGPRELVDEAVDVGEWLGRQGCAPLQPFIWSDVLDQRFQVGEILLPAIGKTAGGLDERFVDVLVRQLDVWEEYNHRHTLAVELLAAMNARAATGRIGALIDEFFAEIGGKRDFFARLAMIPWTDLLVTVGRSLSKLADRSSPLAQSARADLKRLARYAVDNYAFNVAAASGEALLAWGRTDLDWLVRALLNDNDDPSRLSGLRILEQCASEMPAKARRDFIESGFPNPDDSSNSVTLLYHRACLALAAEDKKLSKQCMPISKALELSRELSNYGADRWQEWRISECETVGRFPELDLSSIEHHLYSSSSEVRRAAAAAYAARHVQPPETRPICWIDIWRIRDEASSEAEASTRVAELLSDSRSVGRTPAAAWLWEHASEATAPVVASVVNREIEKFRPPGAGEDISSELEWLIRALVRHSQYPSAAGTVLACLQSGHDHLAGPVLSEIESLPDSFAPALLAYGKDCTGWRRVAIANWVLSRMQRPEIATAVTSAKLNERTLRSWTK